MDRSRIDRKYKAAEFAAVMDAAKARAVRTRQEAMEAFWNDVFAALRKAWRGAFHSAGAQIDRPINAAWPRATR